MYAKNRSLVSAEQAANLCSKSPLVIGQFSGKGSHKENLEKREKKLKNDLYYNYVTSVTYFLDRFTSSEARDCKVSSWQPWGKCSAKCGIGFMKRTRRIIQFPENGGEPCPVLRQTRGCNVNACLKNKRESRRIHS